MLLVAIALSAPPPVVGGDLAPPGRWPDAVAVYSDSGLTCTGTLIAPDLVLTAGHCMALVESVVVGAVDPAVEGEAIAVIDAIPYPDSTATYDVGLLRLETPASAAPRGLLVDCLADFLVDGAQATVAGYGRTDAAAQAGQGQLREARLPVLDADCSDLSRGCRPLVSPGGEVLAGGDGLDSCTGDSGGPLYLGTPDGQIWLAGVVSRGAFPATAPCGDGGIYVRVDAVRDWIEATGGVTLSAPDCAGLDRPPQVSASVLQVTQGRSAPLPLTIVDPEGLPTTVTVIEPPTRGFVDAANVFHAAPFQVGADRLRVAVTDEGGSSVELDVVIAVSPAGHLPEPTAELPRGCSTVTGPSWWAFPGFLLWIAASVQTRRPRPVYRG